MRGSQYLCGAMLVTSLGLTGAGSFADPVSPPGQSAPTPAITSGGGPTVDYLPTKFGEATPGPGGFLKYTDIIISDGNPPTVCGQVLVGAVSFTPAPTNGSITLGTATIFNGGQPCGDQDPKHAFERTITEKYKWTNLSASSPIDPYTIHYTNVDHIHSTQSDFDTMVQAELIPTSATNTWIGWDVGGGQPTKGQWEAQLTPETVNFGTVTVVEVGAVVDTCWFPDSVGKQFTALGKAGGQVPFTIYGPNNDKYIDEIGWTPDGVDYYRSVARAPCGFTASQQMQIDYSSYGDAGGPYPYGKPNILTATIGLKTVSASRAGNTKTEPY